MPALEWVLQQGTAGQNEFVLGPDDIREILPHREPFLFIQSVTVDVDSKTAHALMDMEATHSMVGGHFPNAPIVPGVIVLEAIAQTAAVLGLIFEAIESSGKTTTQMGFSAAEVKWRKSIIPETQVHLQAHLVRKKSGFWVFTGQATVYDEVACEVEKLIGAEWGSYAD